MTSLDFAKLVYAEKGDMLSEYMNAESKTAVAVAIASLGLSPEHLTALGSILNDVLTDAFYTLLLGLDGCANIGGRQETYRLFDESGQLLAGDGELEAAAWEVFHGQEAK